MIDCAVIEEVGVGIVAVEFEYFGNEPPAWPALDLDDDVERVRNIRLDGVSAIYDKSFSEICSYFGLRIGDLGRDRASMGVPRTHLVDREGDADSQTVALPVEFKPEFRLENTNLLATVVLKWDQFPIGLLQHLDLRKSMYGYIGLEDR
ncbi:MAG: hypothetical protein ACRD3B_07665, partial [Candidatus Sulfotelmatobacter sp.]